MKKIVLLLFIGISSYAQNSTGIAPVLNVDMLISPPNLIYIQTGSNLWQKTNIANLRIPASQVTGIKLSEKSSGVTNASGVYTFTFANPYSIAPNVQANIINATDTQNIRTTSVTNTSVTVVVRNRVDVAGLLPTWTNVAGANVDILVTEK